MSHPMITTTTQTSEIDRIRTMSWEKLPFVPECELQFEGGSGENQCFDQCPKKDGHKHLIAVKDFKMDDLPVGFRTETMMNDVEQYCNRTVKVVTNYTSLNRPDTYPNSRALYPYSWLKGNHKISRCGTGYIRQSLPSGLVKDKQCPCHICRKSNNPVKGYLYMTVTTALHVVFDNDEAQRTKFELFYNSENRKGVKFLYGVSIHGEGGDGDSGYEDCDEKAKLIKKCMEDRSLITCVTHEVELIGNILNVHSNFDFETPPFPLTVSHPHGLGKKISTVGGIESCILPVPVNISTEDIYFIGPHSKCRVQRLASTITSSNEFFKIVESNDSSDKQEIEYTLKEGIRLSLPPDATYLCQYLAPFTHNVNPQKAMYIKRFPAGTRFTYKNCQDSFLLPDVEFHTENGKTIEFPKHSPYFLTYTMPTCPGSSGAPVRGGSHIFPLYWDSHSGAFYNGTNRSGIHSPNYVNR